MNLILPFDEVVEALGRTGERSIGLKNIPLDSIVGTNLPNQGVRLSYKSSLKAFNPGTLGPWRHTSGTVGVAGGDTILGGFDAVCDRVAHQVNQRIRNLLDDAVVQFRFATT